MSCVNSSVSMVNGLPTLQCLLQLCDIRKLSLEVVNEFALRDASFGEALSSGSNKRHARARVVSVIQTMRQQKLCPHALDGWVLAPTEEFCVEGKRPHICQRVNMLLAYRNVGGPYPWESCTGDTWEFMGDAAASDGASFLLDYSTEPWENVLSVGVLWSGSWTCCDRYRALASAVWEMTRWGFDSPQAAPSVTQAYEDIEYEDLAALTRAQNLLMVPAGYHKEYALRISELARRMNDQAESEFWERLR